MEGRGRRSRGMSGEARRCPGKGSARCDFRGAGFVLLAAVLLMVDGAATVWASEDDAGLCLGKIRFHGYGEFHYNSPRGTRFPDRTQSDQADAHRFVLEISYSWNDRWEVEAEVDFEHAATVMELEELYVDYSPSAAINFRTGVVLMPVGPVNERHEPTRFYSVERPQMDEVMIPTTWQELGAGFYGSLETPIPIRYRSYIVSGLDASNFDAAAPIRAGRGHAAEANSFRASWVGRIEVDPVLGLTLGGSVYVGNAAVQSGNREIGDGDVTLWEVDGRWRRGFFELQGRYSALDIDNAAFITANNGGNSDPVPERAVAGLVEGALHLGTWFFPDSEKDLVPFVRWEDINTQDKVPAGTVAKPQLDRQILTTGLAFYPFEDLVFKADYESWDDAAGRSENRFNLGVGFVY